MPLRLDGVTSALTFFSDLFVEDVPDGPATSARLFMYLLFLDAVFVIDLSRFHDGVNGRLFPGSGVSR